MGYVIQFKRGRPSGSRSGAVTEQRAAILAFIIEFIAARGFPPTRRELGDAVGCSAPQAQRQLRALESMGLIELDDQTARGIRILAPRLAA